jgi:hypothetical protein
MPDPRTIDVHAHFLIELPAHALREILLLLHPCISYCLASFLVAFRAESLHARQPNAKLRLPVDLEPDAAAFLFRQSAAA